MKILSLRGYINRETEMRVSIDLVSTPDTHVRALIEELDAELGAIYTYEQCHGLKIDQIFQPEVLFFIARVDGEPVGCGGIALGDGLAEVKRMYVRRQARGRGVADAILARLLEEARARGIARIVLETGDVQHAAMRFYQRAGFTSCEAFGAYRTKPPASIVRSRFFEKLIHTSED
jgi:putative acetyltransferase